MPLSQLNEENAVIEPNGSIAIYQTADSQTQIEVCLQDETVWLRQEQMSELFGGERSVITKHIRNVFIEGELDEKSNVQILHIAGLIRDKIRAAS